MIPGYFVTVVMPALNEGKNIIVAISNTLAGFDDIGLKGEIIVVNDGSEDNTDRLVEEKMKSDNRIRMIVHDTPKGIGSCFWDGVDIARGDIVTMLPGDNENDPWETLRYVELLEHVDIVIPFAYNKNIRSLSRNILSRTYLSIINLTFMTSFNYTNSTVIYRKSVLQQLRYRCHSFFFQTDILVRTVRKGYLFAEVPYRLGSRKAGSSKLISFPSLWKTAKDYFKLVKDVYCTQRKELNERCFSPDSSTAKRQNPNNKYKEI
ncbi:MAG: glycosyltransferase family 2 protein [Candidatus Omnitrophica bacterium]|nr:glycosyltransferase family 2 protein [Candidatus Omnitrophota bacterium]